MSRLGRWIVALLVMLFRRRRRHDRREDSGRIVAEGPPEPRSELVVVGLLVAAALCAVGFMVAYGFPQFGVQHQVLGLTLGFALIFAAAALMLIGKRLVPNEEIEHDYPTTEHPEAVQEVEQVVGESGSRITRKGLLIGAGGAAGGTIGLAALAPVLSFGPWFATDPLYQTPWKRGRRLVDDKGKPYKASDVEENTFYTAFPEGASLRDIGAPVVLIRMNPASLNLPPERSGWAPQGLLAYSKICTHAGCAIALYRKPTFAPAEPRRALVCPCHYSTFDPASGGNVIFGPAGRNLPQLPLAVDAAGEIRAGGNFSEAIGPSWWGVRMEKPQ